MASIFRAGLGFLHYINNADFTALLGTSYFVHGGSVPVPGTGWLFAVGCVGLFALHLSNKVITVL
jgi:hypothetical protein